MSVWRSVLVRSLHWGVALPAVAATPTCSAGTCTVTFSGSGDSFTVPAGVSSVNVAIKGAAGGRSAASGRIAPGGAFHFTYPVTSGSQLRMLTGGGGAAGLSAEQSGAGGDGAFLVDGLTLVAAAGGGGGAVGFMEGGAGGSFGPNQNGMPGLASDATPAQGGTSTSGGSGGTGSGATGAAGTGPATATTPGAGGTGADGAVLAGNRGTGGGGGGGGYYGGGGGGASSGPGNGSSSSGGGGSGYLISSATGAAIDTPNAGAASLVVTYADPGQVDAPAVNPGVGLAVGVVGVGVVGGVVWVRRRSAAAVVK